MARHGVTWRNVVGQDLTLFVGNDTTMYTARCAIKIYWEKGKAVKLPTRKDSDDIPNSMKHISAHCRLGGPQGEAGSHRCMIAGVLKLASVCKLRTRSELTETPGLQTDASQGRKFRTLPGAQTEASSCVPGDGLPASHHQHGPHGQSGRELRRTPAASRAT